MQVLGSKLSLRHLRRGVEALGSEQVDVVNLAIPTRHGEQGGLRPQFWAQRIDGQAGLFTKFPLYGLEARLAWFDSTAGICPETIGEREALPVEADEEYVVLWVEDQRAHALSQPHELWTVTNATAGSPTRFDRSDLGIVAALAIVLAELPADELAHPLRDEK